MVVTKLAKIVPVFVSQKNLLYTIMYMGGSKDAQFGRRYDVPTPGPGVVIPFSPYPVCPP